MLGSGGGGGYVYAGLYGHAGGEIGEDIQRLVEEDFEGDALDDLDVVAGGVFGREEAEAGAAAELEAIDVGLEVAAWEGIDANADGLAGVHVGELGFLEIGGDPDVVLDDGEEGLAGGGEVAGLDGLVRDAAGLGGGDAGVGELEGGVIDGGLCDVDGGLCGADLGIGGLDGGLGGLDGAACGLEAGVGGIDVLLGNGAEVLLVEAGVAGEVDAGDIELGGLLGELGAGLIRLGLCLLDEGLGLEELGLGFLEGDLGVAGIELDEEGAFFYLLVVIEKDCLDLGADPGADLDDVSIDECVIGGLVAAGEAPCDEGDDAGDDEDSGEDEEGLALAGAGRGAAGGGPAIGGVFLEEGFLFEVGSGSGCEWHRCGRGKGEF